MGVFGDAWGTASGGAPLREASEARARARKAAVRRVRRLVDRGEAAATVPDAELAVALARDRQRAERQGGAGTWAFFLVMVIAWFGFAVGELIAGHAALGVFFSAAFLFGVRTVWLRRRRAGCAARAERRNREVLERAGHPYRSTGSQLVRPPVPMVVVAAAVLLVYYVVFFGSVTTLFDDEPLSGAGVLSRGLLFGVLMTLANVTWVRRRNQRAARAETGRAPGATSPAGGPGAHAS